MREQLSFLTMVETEGQLDTAEATRWHTPISSRLSIECAFAAADIVH